MSTFHELHAAAQTADTVVGSANDRDVLPDLTLLEFEDLMDLRVSGVGFPELAKRDISVPDADPGSPVADLALLSIEELMDLSVSTPSDDEPEADPDKEESTVLLHRGSATTQPFVFAALTDWLNLSPAAFETSGNWVPIPGIGDGEVFLTDYDAATADSNVNNPGNPGNPGNPVNNDPVAVDDYILTAVNNAVVVNVLANDSDIDVNPLNIASSTQGANGVVVINPDNTVTYTPTVGFTGIDNFAYTVADGNGGVDTTTVIVSVGNAIEGGPGDDVLQGTNGPDIIFGYAGDDTIHGHKGADALFGGDGNDMIHGQNGDDVLYGGLGDDSLFGGNNADLLDGGQGDDLLNGNGGVDILLGGLGDDSLVWDINDATIDGGAGIDSLLVQGGDVDLTVFGGTILGIESIDLEADAGANAVTLSAQDVLDISDSDTLAILGDSGDNVDAGSGWTDGGFDGSGNHTYTQMVGGMLATLLVDPDIAVNGDILS